MIKSTLNEVSGMISSQGSEGMMKKGLHYSQESLKESMKRNMSVKIKNQIKLNADSRFRKPPESMLEYRNKSLYKNSSNQQS
jgi:hypothetical protein